MTKKSIKTAIIDRVENSTIGRMWWGFMGNELGVVDRKIEIRKSPWHTQETPNYCIECFYGDKAMVCENGLTQKAAIDYIHEWHNNSGFLNGRPACFEFTDTKN